MGTQAGTESTRSPNPPADENRWRDERTSSRSTADANRSGADATPTAAGDEVLPSASGPSSTVLDPELVTSHDEDYRARDPRLNTLDESVRGIAEGDQRPDGLDDGGR
jgi:hypothetical protein